MSVWNRLEWAAVVLLLAFCIFAGGYTFGRKNVRNGSDSLIVVRTDTLTIRDTIVHYTPKETLIRTVDTFLVEIADTIVRHDTAFIALPKEVKTYKGEDYEAQVSGYRPALDYVKVYPETRYVTTTVKEPSEAKRLGLGISGGCALGKGGLTPYVGVGLNWNLINF